MHARAISRNLKLRAESVTVRMPPTPASVDAARRQRVGFWQRSLLMETQTTPSWEPPPASSKSRNPLLLGCGGLLLLLLLLAAAVAGTVWWMQRPMTPVVLSEQEKAVVDEKIKLLGFDPANLPHAGNRTVPAVRVESPDQARGPSRTLNPAYVPGSKVFKLSEREANGLLNLNTDLGKMVRLEFAQDAVHAYFAIPIPEDFPIGAGTVIRARGRFKVSIGPGGAPFAILDDVTIFGISLPKDWLGGIKGENLLGDAMGGKNGTPVVRGIKSLHIVPGALVLEVED